MAVTTIGTQSMSSCFNLSVEKVGYTFAYCLLFAVLLTGNALIGIVVFQKVGYPVNIKVNKLFKIGFALLTLVLVANDLQSNRIYDPFDGS